MVVKSPRPEWSQPWVRSEKDGSIVAFDTLQAAEAEAARLNREQRKRDREHAFYEVKIDPPHLHRLTPSPDGEHGYSCEDCGSRNPRMERMIKVRGRLCRKCLGEARFHRCTGLQAGATSYAFVWHITGSDGRTLCRSNGVVFEGDQFVETLVVEDREALMSAD